MKAVEALQLARQLAEEMGIEHADITGTPRQQVSAIKDRISRKVIALREESWKLSEPRRQQRQAGMAA